jgi:hypothetical protein
MIQRKAENRDALHAVMKSISAFLKIDFISL